MDTDLTHFLRGALRIHQPKSGYRFNVDSVILACFAWTREGERVLDLGTGTGILLLLIARWHHPSSLTGIEIRPEMAALAMRNLEENGWGGVSRVVAADYADPDSTPAGPFDLAVCNPPFYTAGRGVPSTLDQRRAAREGPATVLADVAGASARMLAPGGRLCLIAPAERQAELHGAFREAGLRLNLVRMVHPDPGRPAHRILAQAVKSAPDGSPPLALPPLFLRGSDGAYAPEIERRLSDEIPPGPRFMADAMLGTLARYLRLCGLDTAYGRVAGDEWLGEEAARAGRVLLTRDRPLLEACRRAGREAFDPASDRPKEQFDAVTARYGLSPGPLDPRCLRCNAALLEVDRRETVGRVPPYTFLTHRRFSACPCCGKLTWEGSHLERFRREVAARGAADPDKRRAQDPVVRGEDHGPP